MSAIDTSNDFLVGGNGSGEVVILMAPSHLSKEQALRLAAWLVAVADQGNEFPAVLEAVLNT